MGVPMNLSSGASHRYSGLALLTLAYPLAHFVVCYIPNPFVPTANVALNMIFPVLAGYLYGPWSGALAGLLGTGLSALAGQDIYDALSILPHGLMGYVAGRLGARRSPVVAALSLGVGHGLNVLFYGWFQVLEFEYVSTFLLGLAAETTIGIVAVLLLVLLLPSGLYAEAERRW